MIYQSLFWQVIEGKPNPCSGDGMSSNHYMISAKSNQGYHLQAPSGVKLNLTYKLVAEPSWSHGSAALKRYLLASDQSSWAPNLWLLSIPERLMQSSHSRLPAPSNQFFRPRNMWSILSKRTCARAHVKPKNTRRKN